jgi:DNA (cytosine-5)-methyltransferase 1
MTTKPLTFISLFAGIGGFDLALERAGMQCIAQVEIDSKARAVLHHHWPSVPQFEDVREVGAHNLPKADVICGGFPCQDLSVAGKRAGFAGQRSVLFYEMTRIVNELRPAFLIFENVPGLLSSRGGADFHGVLSELDSIGYCGAWTMLDAQFFGVAQRRRRIFGVFARADIGAGRCAEILSLAARLPGHSAPRRGAGQKPARETSASAGDGGAGTAHSVAAPLVARQAKGGFTDPVSDNIIAFQEQGGFGLRTFSDTAPTLQSEQGTHQGGPSYLPMVFQQNKRDELRDVGAVAGAINSEPGMHNQNFVAYNIQHNDGGDHKRADRPNGGLYVNKTDTALTVGTTDLTAVVTNAFNGYTGGADDNDAQANHIVATAFVPHHDEHDGRGDNFKQSDKHPAIRGPHGSDNTIVAFSAGNSANARSMGESENITPPLRSSDSGTNQTPTISGSQIGVRRLTPVECERLQGFPDNWTANQADSARYRQLGNAVAVPVVEWIARRLVANFPTD